MQSWPRRRSFVFDLALALVVFAIGAAASFFDVPDGSRWIVAARIGAGALGAAALVFRRRTQYPLLAASLLGQFLNGEVDAFLPFAAYAVFRYGPRTRTSYAAFAVVGALGFQPWEWTRWGEVVNNVVIVALFVAGPALLGAWVRTRAELLVALRERAERAEQEQQALAREAVLEERVRIAREMHDVVGHRVSLMVLQAGAIDMAADDPDRVRLIAGQLQDAGRRSLTEVRQLLGLVQDGDAPLAPQPTLADLDELVENARRSGLDVTMRRTGRREVEPTAGRAAYRVVQEALTNAGKHAPGGPVTVTVDAGDALAVTVTNGRATRAATALPSGGLGLVGLRERVRTVGGTFRAEPRLDGGFSVEAVLPG